MSSQLDHSQHTPKIRVIEGLHSHLSQVTSCEHFSLSKTPGISWAYCLDNIPNLASTVEVCHFRPDVNELS